jgi:hypothetical protein
MKKNQAQGRHENIGTRILEIKRLSIQLLNNFFFSFATYAYTKKYWKMFQFGQRKNLIS